MKNRLFTILFLVLFTFSLQACFFSLQGSGKIIREKRNISAVFNSIRISNHGNLYVTLGKTVSLFIEGDDNILPHIYTRVEGDTLELGSRRSLRRGWSSRHGIKYLLTVPAGQLSHLALTSHGDAEIPELTGSRASVRLSSHGDISIDRIKADDFRLNLSSHGDVRIRKLIADSLNVRMTSHGNVRIQGGTVRNLDVSLTSHGHFRASDLASDICRVSSTSHGSIRVWAKKSLKARLTSHGKLYYRGNPDIDASRSSRKKMRNLD